MVVGCYGARIISLLKKEKNWLHRKNCAVSKARPSKQRAQMTRAWERVTPTDLYEHRNEVRVRVRALVKDIGLCSCARHSHSASLHIRV